MTPINICIELISDSSHFSSSQDLEKKYIELYKPLLSFLYTHPKLKITFSFSGQYLDFFETNHKEILLLLSELSGRNQIEILGGGYHSPIFPLLFSVDRSGQIELLTSTLRSTIGKRPRGAVLFGSIWDPSLITTLQSCGIEYIHLDSSLIPTSKKTFYPLITSEQGKNVKVLPWYKELLPESKETFSLWLERIYKSIKKENVTSSDIKQGFSSIISLAFTEEKFLEFFSGECFKTFSSIEYTGNINDISFTLPSLYLKDARKFIPSYIPAGMDWNIAQWAKSAFCKSENKSHFPLTIYDYLNTYVQNKHLYERMMNISVMLSQLHGGDKFRKTAAYKKLWESQSGYNYLTPSLGLPAIAEKRHNAFFLLNEAEILIRECKPLKESLTNYDYNGDGLSEYLCRMENYQAVISLLAGQIIEFDSLASKANYASSLSRNELFDKVQDDYQRGLFVEHLFEVEQIKQYNSLEKVGNGVFSRIQFYERKIDSKRKEIHLEGQGEFSSLKLPVTLRKNYIMSSSGCTVQYILRNDGPLPFKAVFVVELNFSQTNFVQDGKQYSLELIEHENKKELFDRSAYKTSSGVSFVQISDVPGKLAFVLEPNEDSGFSTNLISFSRPGDDGKPRETSSTRVVSLYWNVELSAGMEIEKNISLSIIQSKKKRSVSK